MDISKYTDMEVEHKHDTANAIKHYNEMHVHPETIADFQNSVDKVQSKIQKKALQEWEKKG